MDRRQFVERTLGAVAVSALGACVPSMGRPIATELAAAPASPLDAKSYHDGRRFADTRYGRIAYVERGAGAAALFIHGYPLNGFQWRGAIERLASRRRCIAPDMMGLGYSEVPESQSVAPDAQVAMLVALLDRLEVGRVDVVANDSGGAVAQLLVAAHPDRVRTLLLTNCDVENDSPPPSFLPIIAAAKKGVFADRSIAPALANKELARSARGIGGIAYSVPGNPTDEALDYYFTPLVSSPLRKRQLEAYAIALEQNPLAGVEATLRQRETPVRIVWGAADTVFSAASPDYLDRIFPRSRGVRRVTNAKLFFPEEYPEVIAEEARRLWDIAE